MNIEPSRLRTHIRFFARRRLRFVTAGDLSGRLADDIVCFTFDDAYASTMVHAPRIFEELGTRATFYAVPGNVGASSVWDGELAVELASWTALQEAAGAGHEIGNHSMTHPRLAGLPLDKQVAEVVSAHQSLLCHGITPRSFCYPYGSHDATSREALSRAGYAVGLALGKRPVGPGDDPLSLPRIVVAYGDALPILLYKWKLKPILRRAVRPQDGACPRP